MRDWNFLAKASSQDRERSRSPVKPEESPQLPPVFPLPLPPSLTITAKHKELPSPGQEKETKSKPDSTSYPAAAGMSPLLQQMLTENPVMGAAMQQVMSPGLPSSADLLQQAHALQLLAQLQSVLMMNSGARDQQQNKVRHDTVINRKEMVHISGIKNLNRAIKEGSAFILKAARYGVCGCMRCCFSIKFLA